MRTEHLETVAQVFAAFKKLSTSPRNQNRRLLFRGVPNRKFSLKSTLARLVDEHPNLSRALLYHIEQQSGLQFREKAHLYVDPSYLPPRDGAFTHSTLWWQLMQHYGATTRLLDWTASPYVAAYFACKDYPRLDGAVWVVDIDAHGREMRRRYPEQFESGQRCLPLLDRPDDDRQASLRQSVDFFPCKWPNERMAAQRGWFSCGSVLDIDHRDSIEDAFDGRSAPWPLQLILAKGVKSALMRELWRMNITGETIYTGLHGLAQAMSELSQLLEPEDGAAFEFENGLLRAVKAPRKG